MKIFIIIAILLILAVSATYAQTVIPSTMSVDSFSKRSDGVYTFYRTSPVKDTVNMGKNTQVPCPICPVCPVPVQRFVVGISINPKTGQMISTYNDSSTSTLILKNVIFIQ